MSCLHEISPLVPTIIPYYFLSVIMMIETFTKTTLIQGFTKLGGVHEYLILKNYFIFP
jgi:hypothetical protein